MQAVSFSPEKFHRFAEILFDAMGGQVDANELIAAKAAAVKRQGYKGLSDNELNDLAYSEVVAEMMETALTDTEVMERISARLARDTIRSSEEALNAFADAAEDAVVNYQLQDGQKNNAPEGERFSTRENKQFRGFLPGTTRIFATPSGFVPRSKWSGWRRKSNT